MVVSYNSEIICTNVAHKCHLINVFRMFNFLNKLHFKTAFNGHIFVINMRAVLNYHGAMKNKFYFDLDCS